jgi:PPOX class probable F420-dependent enzyme
MRLLEEEARRRVAAARVLRLATADGQGRPHLVPVTFASRGDVLVTAVDAKPKAHRRLKRLDNVRRNPAVCLLADEYNDDWTRLWWARADGDARVLAGDECTEALGRLAEKYPQYA